MADILKSLNREVFAKELTWDLYMISSFKTLAFQLQFSTSTSLIFSAAAVSSLVFLRSCETSNLCLQVWRHVDQSDDDSALGDQSAAEFWRNQNKIDVAEKGRNVTRRQATLSLPLRLSLQSFSSNRITK